jgi:hypothetical protein
MVSLWLVRALSTNDNVEVIPNDLETLHSSFPQLGDLRGQEDRELPAHRL